MATRVEKDKIREVYREAATDFKTESGISVKNAYTPEDIKHINFEKDIVLPGEYPFTRGHHASMYRGKLWNIREISGCSTPEAFNKRCKFLLISCFIPEVLTCSENYYRSCRDLKS